MPRLDELETLSRFAAGDLSEHEAAQVRTDLQSRPELSEALGQLSRLDVAAKALPLTLGPAEVEELVASVRRPRRAFSRARAAAAAGLAAAVLAAVLAALFATRRAEPRARLVSLSGTVTVNGQPLEPPSQPIDLARGALVRSGSGSAAIIESPRATLLIPRDSELKFDARSSSAVFTLQSGTVIGAGPEVRLSAAGARFEIAGRGVLSWEPEDTLVRVTEGMDGKNPQNLSFKWLKLPIAATIIGGGAVSLFVLEGRAKVMTDPDSLVEVTGGQKWDSRSARPSSISSSTVALRASGEAEQLKPRPKTDPSSSPSSAAVLETLSQEKLIAEVNRLRSENVSLSQKNKELEKKVASQDATSPPPKENFYRVDPEELRARAERGEIRLHPPATADQPLYGPKVANELGLQPSEEAAIREIYSRSSQRIRDGLASLYREIGGDAAVASTLEREGLLNELLAKSTPRDRDFAALTAARERAGLEQPAGPGQASAPLRAYRLFFQEEDRVLSELDALLGPDRAEQFVNHANTSHSTLSTVNRVS